MWNNNAFELYGFDILIDRDLKTHIIEVNLAPSLSADALIDFQIKSRLVTEMLNLIGVEKRREKDRSPV